MSFLDKFRINEEYKITEEIPSPLPKINGIRIHKNSTKSYNLSPNVFFGGVTFNGLPIGNNKVKMSFNNAKVIFSTEINITTYFVTFMFTIFIIVGIVLLLTEFGKDSIIFLTISIVFFPITLLWFNWIYKIQQKDVIIKVVKTLKLKKI